jgi:uncharacterized membrane protein YhhN
MDGTLAPFALACVATLLGVGAMLVADHTGTRAFEFVGKPIASLAFLALGIHVASSEAILVNGPGSPVTTAFVAALALSLVGDMCLMFKTDASFLAGLGAFLLGHVAFLVAFVLRGVSLTHIGFMVVPCLAFGAAVWRWLGPHVPKAMVVPVLAYMSVISGMVACAIGTHGHRPAPYLVLAAFAFFVSDLAVARQKFVNPSHTNRYWGLPLYFGAQLLFAAHLLD